MSRIPIIEIGCGEVNDVRFDAKCDIRPLPHVTLVADMRDLSVIPDNSFCLIKNSACIEHVSPADQIKVVREFHRILMPHGVALVQTPDLDWIESIKDVDEEWYWKQRTGGLVDEFDRHLGLLNKETITKLFTENGFKVLQLHDGSQAAGSLDLYAEKI